MTDEYESLKLENQICFPLYACSKEVVRLYHPILSELDLTYTQYLSMMVLWEHGEMTEGELADIRGREVGFIFQNSQLLPRLDAERNVELPLIYAGVRQRERRRRAREMLERVGLEDRMGHFPNQLSGGQQQRVAIARALVTNPSILLADEPTGALDQKTGRQIMKLFAELHDEGRTIIMITHDMNIAAHAKRVVHIIDGVLTEGGTTADA
mgnify:CR=1 FL=1